MSDESTAPTAPDPEVEALVREHHDAGGCTLSDFVQGGCNLACSGADAIRRAVEAGRVLDVREGHAAVVHAEAQSIADAKAEGANEEREACAEIASLHWDIAQRIRARGGSR